MNKAKRFSKKIHLTSSLTIILIISLAVAFVTISGILIIGARYEKELTVNSFHHKIPDLIVIYTGDYGRIDFGLELAAKFKAPKIFISGVYSQFSLQKIIHQAKEKNKNFGTFLESNLLVDYYSRNTIENVLSTLLVLKQNNQFKDIIIISHDYHIMRIKLIIEQMGYDKKFRIYYYPIESDILSLRGVKILFKEVIKYFRSLFFFLIWENSPL